LEDVEGRNKKAVMRKREQILRRWIPEASETRRFADPGKR
jgi:hypothetical protein